MNTHQGYSKKKLDDTLVLLAGGGDKSLSDFLGGIRVSSSKIQYKTAEAAASWTDLITLVNTDENVKLVDNNSNENVPLLLKNGTGTGTITSSVRTVDGVTVNPSTNSLRSINEIIVGTGGSASDNVDGSYLKPGTIAINNTTAKSGYFLHAGGVLYGRLYVYTMGTASTDNGDGTYSSVIGHAMLTLGNNKIGVEDGTGSEDNNADGIIRLYATNSYYTLIKALGNGTRTFYLPNYAGNMFAVHAGNNNAIGSSTKPVYVDTNGRVKECSEMAVSGHTHPYLYSTQVSSAQNNVTWAIDYAKTQRRAFIYNNSGTEYSYLFGLSTSNATINGSATYPNYGAILKMGYNDKYLRILRVYGGKWYKTNGALADLGSTSGVDWEKIYAGYADSAGRTNTVVAHHSIPSSGTNTQGKWIKFATINLSANNWAPFDETWIFGGTENALNTPRGILKLTGRRANGDDRTTEVSIKWITLDNIWYKDKVVLYKSAANTYDVYISNYGTYDSMNIVRLTGYYDNVTFGNGSWGDLPGTASFTSSLGGNVNYAVSASSAGSANTASDSDKLDGYHEDSFFRYRGYIDVNYVDLATYTANVTNYQNPLNGIWNVSRNGYSDGLITFTGSGSSSGLDIYFNFSKGGAFKFRRRIDSNRLSGGWETFLTDQNYTSYLGYIAKTPVSSNSNAGQSITGTGHITPNTNNSYSLGSSSLRWANVYSVLGNFTGQVTVSVATGTAPFSITSTTKVNNLNADLLDGEHAYQLRAFPNNNNSVIFSSLPFLENNVQLFNATPVVSMENAPEGLCFGPISSYKTYTSGFIAVQPGELLYGEIWVYRASGATGTAGTLYYGVQRFDRNKKPISANVGLNAPNNGYFVASGVTVAADGVWHKYSATHTLPTSHTIYDGSDGKGVYYVKVYVLVNYSSGTIPTYIGRILLKRLNSSGQNGYIATTAIQPILTAGQNITGTGHITPNSSSTYNLGSSSLPWKYTYTKVINGALTGGTSVNASDAGSGNSPRYTPMKWTFNAGITPSNGDIITIKTPAAGHSYGIFLSTNNGANYYPITVNGTSRMTTHYGTGTYLTLLFDSSNSAASTIAFEGGDAGTTINGGTWRVLNYYNSYSNNYHALCTTGATTKAKVASASYFALRPHCTFTLYLQNANTCLGLITLNVNGTGAINIYINGSISSSTNYNLPAGAYFVYYDGTYYYLRTDANITTNIVGNATSLKFIDYVNNIDTDCTLNGIYAHNNSATAKPTNQNGNLLNISNKDICTPGSNGHQIQQLDFTHDGNIWHRLRINSGNWSSWKKIITSNTLLFDIELAGNIRETATLTSLEVFPGNEVDVYFGNCLEGFVDEDGLNIYHKESSVVEGIVGISSATSGSSISIPYINVDTYGHVTAKGTHTHTVTGFAATNHSHGLTNSTFYRAIPKQTADLTWKTSFGYNPSGLLLMSVRMDLLAPNWCVGNYGSGILYGGADTKGFMSSAWNTPKIMWAGGKGSTDATTPVWYMGITGTNATIYNLDNIANHNHDSLYISKTGDTATGRIHFGNGITVDEQRSYFNGGAEFLSVWIKDNLHAEEHATFDGGVEFNSSVATNNTLYVNDTSLFSRRARFNGPIETNGTLYVNDISRFIGTAYLSTAKVSSTLYALADIEYTKAPDNYNITNILYTAPNSENKHGNYIRKMTFANFLNKISTNLSINLNMAATSDSGGILLAARTKYKLTVGNSTVIFTTPADLAGSGADGNTLYYLTLNGTTLGNSGSGNINLGSFYAPTTSGSSGQYLKSNGSSAPSWENFPDSFNLLIGAITNLDTGGTSNGIYYHTDSASGIPNSNYGNLFNFSNVNSPSPGTNQHWIQLLDFTHDGRIWHRQRINQNSWTNWTEVGIRYYLVLNGNNVGDASGTYLGSFYAPTSGGTEGQILKSNGSNPPSWINNSHTLSIETSTNNSPVVLAQATTYKLTAGGSTLIFKTPTDSDNKVKQSSNTNNINRPLLMKYGDITSTADVTNSVYYNTGIYANPNIGELTASSFNGTLKRSASSVGWVNGRNSALVREISSSNYHALWSLKTTNGSWELGEYNATSYTDKVLLTYITDTNFNNSNNEITYQIIFPLKSGTVALLSDIPSAGSSITHKRQNNTYKKYVLGYAKTLATNAAQPDNNSTMSEVWTDSTFYFTNSGAYHTSDIRKKYDIRDLLNEDVNKLFETENGFIRHFKWRESDIDAYGFIAQELLLYCPEAVDIDDNGYCAVNYNTAFAKVLGAMFKKIKQQDKEIEKLREIIEKRK